MLHLQVGGKKKKTQLHVLIMMMTLCSTAWTFYDLVESRCRMPLQQKWVEIFSSA